MWGLRVIAGVGLGLVLIVSGCARFYHQQPDQPTTIYSSADAMAQVYSDPGAASAVADNPWRWVAFMLHPIGALIDYAINRPLYAISSGSPGTSGYTAEDAQLDAQRSGLDFDVR